MPLPYLPQCGWNFVPLIERPGRWEHLDDLLEKLSKDIETPDRDLDPSVLSAIPTVWARPLLFAEALLDKDHPMHFQVRDEWRGLLSLVCLKKHYNLVLNTGLVRLQEFGNQGLSFADALLVLSPEPKQAWCEISPLWLEIDKKNYYLGGTSPKTLVFTAPDYGADETVRRKLSMQVPWLDSQTGRLSDPLKVFGTSERNVRVLVALESWVAELRVATQSMSIPALDRGGQDRLLARLEEWRSELEAWLEIHQRAAQGIQVGECGPSLFAADFEPYCRIPGSVRPPEEMESDLLLAPTKKGARTPLLVTEDAWNRREPPRVQGPITTAQIPYPAAASGEKLGSVEHWWIRPDRYFFTDHVLKLPTRKDRNVLHHADEYIPPLRKEILDFFEPNDLTTVFRWEAATGGIKATLELPLKSSDGRQLSTTVTRTYSHNDTVEVAMPPALEVWPNFRAARGDETDKDQSWRHYYCICEARPGEQLSYSPYPTPPDSTGYRRSDSVLWKLDQVPHAVLCIKGGKPVGLVPIKQPAEIPVGQSKWTVSVDFGTSNTSIFLRKPGQSSPEQLLFKDRCMRIAQGSDEGRNVFLYVNFFPPAEVAGIFPSFFRIAQERGEPLPVPVVDGVVMFVDPIRWNVTFGSQIPGFEENLKWTEDERVRKYVGTYLKQVLLMIAAEARSNQVREVELRFSYPSSFSTGMCNQFTQFWEQVVTWGNSELPLKIALTEVPETESVAACKYLTEERRFNPDAENWPGISVDIGGGTTDVALWMNRELAAQTSLLLGGNELARFARENPEFRSGLARMVPSARIDERFFEKHSTAVLNILLREHGEAIQQTLVAGGKNVLPVFHRARSVVFLTLAAAFYYVGLMIRRRAQEARVLRCDIFLAGNGAKLMSWVSNRQATRKALRGILTSSLRSIDPPLELEGDDIRIHDIFEETAKPKEEVARGLLYDYGRSVGISGPAAIIGEQGYQLGGQDLPWSTDVYNDVNILDPKLDLASLRVPGELTQLVKFVQAFDGEAPDLRVEKLTPFVDQVRIQGLTRQALLRLRSQGEGALVQPFFVEEVRQLLGILHKAPLSRPR